MEGFALLGRSDHTLGGGEELGPPRRQYLVEQQWQHVSRGPSQDHLGHIGEGGTVWVDLDEAGTSGHSCEGKAGRRMHGTGGADHQHSVAPLHDIGRYGFHEHYAVYFDQAVAFGATGRYVHYRELIPGQADAALEAAQLGAVSMYLRHVCIPRSVVQVVHVLGDYVLEQALTLQLHKGVVAWVGPRAPSAPAAVRKCSCQALAPPSDWSATRPPGPGHLPGS